MNTPHLFKALSRAVVCTSAIFGLLASGGLAHAQMAVGKTKFLGNIIAGNTPSSFGTYWNQVSPENAGKWGSVEPVRNQMNWSQLDTAYNYARSNGFPFKQHTFVWGSQEPNWIGGLSAQQQAVEVEEFIRQYCQRYPQTQYIDVVNEPLHQPASYREALGGAGSTGWDWIVWSFQKARQHCPNAKLLINEYGIINDANAVNRYKVIVNILKSRGLIDGVGIQSHHFSMDNLAPATITQNLDSLAQTGVPIYVSELDMTGDDATQLARYQQKFPALWTHPGVVGVTLWGYIEGQTWVANTHLVRRDGSERPALTWLSNYVRSSNPVIGGTGGNTGGGDTGGNGGSGGSGSNGGSGGTDGNGGSGGSGGTGGNTAPTAITVDGNTWYIVVNANSGKVLDLYNWGTGNGAEFRQWNRHDGANQQFQLVSSGNGYYRLKNRHSGKVVDVWNFSTADGAAVNQYTDANGVNQQWRLVGSGNNAVRFINRNSGKALEVASASTADGGDITQYTDYGGRNQTWALVPVGRASPPPTGGAGNVQLPSSFRWNSSEPLMAAKPAARFPEVAIKDPTVVYHNGLWHVFSTQAKGNGWGLEYRSFADWSNAGAATPYFLDSTAIGAGYRAAPFVFFHAPSRLWYLVFQNGNAAYSTNPDISNPGGWSALRTFYSSVPPIVQQNISNGNGYWLDFAVACDSVNCHLFSAGDNGQIYRSQTTLANFPNGFGNTVIALQDANRNNLFEAPQVYKVRETGQYLLIVEAIGSSGRYFRSWTASSLSGTWAPLAATESNPFAGNANVTFPTGKWSQGISHGEILRTGYDQNVEISACNMRFLYQGLAPGASGSYDSLPYRLGLLTQTNSPC